MTLKKEEKNYFERIAKQKMFSLSNEICLLLNKPETYKKLKREHNTLQGLAFRVCTNDYTIKDEKKVKRMIKNGL